MLRLIRGIFSSLLTVAVLAAAVGAVTALAAMVPRGPTAAELDRLERPIRTEGTGPLWKDGDMLTVAATGQPVEWHPEEW